MNQNPRITLEMSAINAIITLSEGNPGALTALMDIATNYTKVDPDSVLRSFTPLLALDNMSIYGSRVWILYKDICASNPGLVAIIVRAVQLGILPDSKVHAAIGAVATRQPNVEPIDFPDLKRKIQQKLPNFGR